jgi:FtsP/CotA-like multicopper oxidase with cupredoxin domain
MMSRNQRLGFLAIAAVIAVVAVIVLAGGGSGDNGSNAKATATPTATATETATEAGTETPTPTPTAKPLPVLRAGKVTKLEFKEGDTIRFQVASDKAQEVHVHGYDLMKDTVPGKPITFSFKASITGIFVVEFEETGEQIGELRVDPK